MYALEVSATEKVDGRRNATRKNLLAGALRLLAAEGYEAATTGRVAASAGIQQSSFYRHFESRDACLAEAIQAAGSEFAARLAARRASVDPTCSPAPDPLHRAGFQLALQHLDENRDIARVLNSLRDADHAAGDATREVLAQLRDELIEDLPRLGIERVPDDAPMRVEMLFALVAQAAAGLRRGDYDRGAVSSFLTTQAHYLWT